MFLKRARQPPHANSADGRLKFRMSSKLDPYERDASRRNDSPSSCRKFAYAMLMLAFGYLIHLRDQFLSCGSCKDAVIGVQLPFYFASSR